MFWISWFDSLACGPEEPRGRFSRTTGASEPGYNRVGGNLVLIYRNCQGQSRRLLVNSVGRFCVLWHRGSPALFSSKVSKLIVGTKYYHLAAFLLELFNVPIAQLGTPLKP